LSFCGQAVLNRGLHLSPRCTLANLAGIDVRNVVSSRLTIRVR
jgi:hypothetical protein